MAIGTGIDARGRRFVTLGGALAPVARGAAPHGAPDWSQASPAHIGSALERALRLPSGGWFVVDASRRIGDRPRRYVIDGQELVAWRCRGELRVAPDACPHMGAPLSRGRVQQGRLVCPWHGLALDGARHGRWAALATHDDGVLAWVRPGPAEPDVPLPILPPRPARYLDAVVRLEARCEPADVLANRLDPWHGVWLHPYAFARLRVLDRTDDVLAVRVAFRVAGPLCVEVDCTFRCPDPRTIVMTIVAGEGAGSVVETHATPTEPGRTAIVEATLATSDRPGFAAALRGARLVRPLIAAAARRLWVDDAAYAERTAAHRAAPGATGDRAPRRPSRP